MADIKIVYYNKFMLKINKILHGHLDITGSLFKAQKISVLRFAKDYIWH